MKQKELNKN